MVRKRHCGDRDVEVIRVLVIDKATFTVTYISCSLLETKELERSHIQLAIRDFS